MELDKIIAISGRPGLFEVQVQTRSGFIAHSLVDGKRISASLRDQVSLLSEINIYGLQAEVPLADVFQNILAHEKGALCSVKSKAPATDLEAYFFEVFQDYDEERVYPSIIKKIIHSIQSANLTYWPKTHINTMSSTQTKIKVFYI